MSAYISIRGARLHNLKNIDLDIPKGKLVVLTGVSGSGKSTLGFDILYQEGLRQYIESLGMLGYGLGKPPVASIAGLSPAISLDQHLRNSSPRSTVGTLSEVYTYLRLLYARLGERPCPSCGQLIKATAGLSAAQWEEEAAEGASAEPEQYFACLHCGAPVLQLRMGHFTFNKPAGACPTCTGLGVLQQVDLKRIVDFSLGIADGAVKGWHAVQTQYYSSVIAAAFAHYDLKYDPYKPIRDYTQPEHDLLFHGVKSPLFTRHYPNTPPPSTARQGRFEGLATAFLRRYAERISEPAYREKMAAYLVTQPCPGCLGRRLRAESRAVLIQGRSIVDLSKLSLTELAAWLEGLPSILTGEEALLAAPILADLQTRIAGLIQVGIGYLSSERTAPTLSAGEAQRLRLAALLNSSLSGVLYVFDEPTIGLHQRDTGRLLQLLLRLRDLGNTVLVIEHDLQIIKEADWLIDFGPGAGNQGGQIVAQGISTQVMQEPASLTGQYLSGIAKIPLPQSRRIPGTQYLTVHGARANNLKKITMQIPLGLLVALTGVSGSGKSSLLFDILERAGHQHFYGARERAGEHDGITGWENLRQLVTIAQEPIGRVPRSNVATYSEVYTPLRQLFAQQPGAKQMGLSARHFSFNLPGGRCERCQGTGVLSVPMHFLPEASLPCPVCHGSRFKEEVLSVRYEGLNIADALALTVDQAAQQFAQMPALAARLGLLHEVGLGYLQLGQSANTLSGGEAQRIKLAKELGRKSRGRTLYLMSEPTTGLHPADITRLLGVCQRLVDAGNSVVIEEHNLDLIKCADWVIDLGPEGGAAGGQVVFEGTPGEIMVCEDSHTGKSLREWG